MQVDLATFLVDSGFKVLETRPDGTIDALKDGTIFADLKLEGIETVGNCTELKVRAAFVFSATPGGVH